MAQVTFTMPQVTCPITSPARRMSWDTAFTIILIMCICCCGCIFIQTPSSWWCTPDAQPSIGSNGSDCCSTNGVDSKGNCQPRSPMGVPAYGMQGGA